MECPFCGARQTFIREGAEANPIINNKIELTELSGRNLEETLALEIKANLIYLCMARNADNYERKVMYERLAKVELEHASVCIKLMDIAMPKISEQNCSEDDVENFEKTIELEEHATDIYARFAKEAAETDLRIFFTALTQVESDHIKLIKNYL